MSSLLGFGVKSRARWTMKNQSQVSLTSSSMRKKTEPCNVKGLDLELKMKPTKPMGNQSFFEILFNGEQVL